MTSETNIRSSKFAYQIKGNFKTYNQRDIKQQFIEQTLRKYSETNIPTEVQHLMELARKALDVAIKKGEPFDAHQSVLNYIRLNSKNAIGTEIPVYIFALRGHITGHIDLLMVIGDTLYVCDYKPRELLKTRIPQKGKNDRLLTSRNFINSVPQVASYALIVKKMFGIKNVKCVSFNEDNLVLYEPEGILKDITIFMYKEVNKKPIWGKYLFFLMQTL